MECKIVEKGAMKFVGMHRRSTQKNNTIPQLWEEFMERGKEIRHVVNPNVAFGVCFHEEVENFTDETPFSYLAGMEVDSMDDIPEGMMVREIPAAKYAVFTHKGSLETLGETYQAIYFKWAKETEYTLAKADMFELYDERFKCGEPDSEFDLYVPIQ